MGPKRHLNWDTIRRAAGLVFLSYLIFANPEGIPVWIGALIAGLLGFQDVLTAQWSINRRVKDEELK